MKTKQPRKYDKGGKIVKYDSMEEPTFSETGKNRAPWLAQPRRARCGVEPQGHRPRRWVLLPRTSAALQAKQEGNTVDLTHCWSLPFFWGRQNVF